MGIVYIDRGENINHRRKYPYRLFLKTLFYANLSEDKESYPTEARKQQVNKYALGGLKKNKNRLSEGKESFRLVMRGYYEVWGQAGTGTVILRMVTEVEALEVGIK